MKVGNLKTDQKLHYSNKNNSTLIAIINTGMQIEPNNIYDLTFQLFVPFPHICRNIHIHIFR